MAVTFERRKDYFMFAGIIQATGKISSAKARGDGLRIAVATALDLSDVRAGDSVAVNGICLTVVANSAHSFSADVSRETLNCTAGFAEHEMVNLEKALRISDRINGHLVSGHIDGTGQVLKFEPAGECYRLSVKIPRGLAKYIARKGSIAINGISLTVNKCSGSAFSVNLIPHTLETTTMKHLEPGSRVNVEVDLISRYVEQLVKVGGK